jgi:hypothetical protein
MKKTVLIRSTKNLFLTSCLAAISWVQGQEIIYQQNFDGNNGTFTNTIVSQNTAINGWLASSTAPQYAQIYRHLWNFSNVTSGGVQEVMPISGRSLGMGFYEGNDPFQENLFFATYAGEMPEDQPFYTTRWAHVGFSTVGYENITVEFKWRCTGEIYEGTVYDYGTVNTSIDGGATWLMDISGGQGGTTSEHGSFNGGLYFGNPDVQTATLVLPDSRSNQANFRLAFRMVVDEGYGTGGGFIIDDIIVRGTPIEILANTDLEKGNFNVYKDGNEFVVKSTAVKIQFVELFDLTGKKISTQKSNGNEIRIPSNQLSKGVYILKANLENGEVLTKKIVK